MKITHAEQGEAADWSGSMGMRGSVIKNQDITELEKLIFHDGRIIPRSFDEVNNFTQEQISFFCHKYGIYQIPTLELIQFLQDQVGDDTALEIGSGNGCIGRALKIRRTDNKCHLWPEVQTFYTLGRQPSVNYGDDVEEISANDAVRKYKPHTVIASWVTELFKSGIHKEGYSKAFVYGIDEQRMFRDGIKKYIHIGNEGTHGEKRILNTRKHKKISFPWLLSRSLMREENVIYIIGNEQYANLK